MKGLIVQVLFRYEDPKKIIGRAWIGQACIPVWIMSSFSSLLCFQSFQFGIYMSQTSLMLKPTMEGWQDRELDAKTSYLMDNVKYTSRGTLLQLSWLEQFYTFLILGLGVFWLIFLPALGIYYTIRTRHTVRATLQDDQLSNSS